MSRKVGGFGLLALAIAAAIALLLAASAWRRQAETVLDVEGALVGTSSSSGNGPTAHPPVSGGSDALDRSVLPGVNDMKNATTDHSDQLREALDATNP